jgi:hypothetical protein
LAAPPPAMGIGGSASSRRPTPCGGLAGSRFAGQTVGFGASCGARPRELSQEIVMADKCKPVDLFHLWIA